MYEYTQIGLPVAAVQTTPDGAEVARVGYVYDDHGRVITLTRGNGVATAYTYTSANLVESETTTKGGQPQETREYAYNPAGQLTSRTDTIHDDATGTAGSTHTVYGYDAHDRLTSSTLHDGVDASALVTERTVYTVTVSGDIDAETVTRNPGAAEETSITRQFTYGPNGTLTGIATTHSDGTTTTAGQEYDPAGNLTRAVDGTRYAYNAANRQTGETTPTGEVIATGYWATGHRASLTTTDGGAERVTGFYWDGTTLANDTHTTGEKTHTASYLIGASGNRHTRTTSGDGAGAAYYTHDRHGNVTTLTAGDGTPTTRYTYTDYGTPTTHPSTNQVEAGVEDAVEPNANPVMSAVGDATYQPFQYAGEYTNPAGAQHLAAREYDPGTLRFTTEDTAQLHNTYAYADLNPIMKVDPSGHTATPDWFTWLFIGVTVALAVMGAVMTAIPTGGASLGATITGLTVAGKALFGVNVTLAMADLGVAAAHAAVQISKSIGTTVAIDEESLGHAGMGIGLAAGLAGGAGIIYGTHRLLKTTHAATKNAAATIGPAQLRPLIKVEHTNRPVTLIEGVVEAHNRARKVEQHKIAKLAEPDDFRVEAPSNMVLGPTVPVPADRDWVLNPPAGRKYALLGEEVDPIAPSVRPRSVSLGDGADHGVYRPRAASVHMPPGGPVPRQRTESFGVDLAGSGDEVDVPSRYN
jgi:RHS repeat-associated protein